MKITNANTNLVNQAYTIPVNRNQNKIPDKEKTDKQTIVDSVSLSTGTKDLQKVFTAMEVEPKDRNARVAALKNEVIQGQYTVNAEKVASKMAGYLLNELG